MSAKTIFIIVITIVVTVILMKNTDEVDIWLFGEASISKLAIFGTFFGLGLIVGFMLGRPGKNVEITEYDDDGDEPVETKQRTLTDEDRDYIN